MVNTRVAAKARLRLLCQEGAVVSTSETRGGKKSSNNGRDTTGDSGHHRKSLLLLLGGSGSGKGMLLKKLSLNTTYIEHGLDEYIEYIPDYQKSMRQRVNKRKVFKDAYDSCVGVAIKV